MTVSPARRRSVRVSTRLVLVLAVPSLVLVAGMAAEGASILRARSAAAGTAGHATLVLAVQDLVHTLQHERALLTALLAGEPGVRADLTPARAATGRAQAALTRLLASMPPTSYGPVRDALARLPALDHARTASPALPLDPDTPAAPGGPASRARPPARTPTGPLTGPYGATVSPGTAVASRSPAPGPTSPVPSPLATVPPHTHPTTPHATTLPSDPEAATVPARPAAHTIPVRPYPTTIPTPQEATAGPARHHAATIPQRAPGTLPMTVPGTSSRAGFVPDAPARDARVALPVVVRSPGSASKAPFTPTTLRQRAARPVPVRLAGGAQATAIPEPLPENASGVAPSPDQAPVGTPSGQTVGTAADEQGAPADRGPVVRQEVARAFADAIESLIDAVFAEGVSPDGVPATWTLTSGMSAGETPTDGTSTHGSSPGGTRTGGMPADGRARRLRAVEAIGRAKEAAARERAVVTAAFATGAFTRSEYVSFLEARASLADALAAFRRTATPEGVEALARAQRGTSAARTARLERRALAASPGTPLTARTRTWLAVSSAYLDALHAVQRSAAYELRAHAVAAGERQIRRLWWVAGVGAAFLLGMAALGTFMVRSVMRPLRKITGEATALAGHVSVLESAEAARPPSRRRVGRSHSAGPGPSSVDEEHEAAGSLAAHTDGPVTVREDLPRHDESGQVPARLGGEFGRLAGAVGELHEAAVRMAAGRAAVRRDAAASLGGLGARHRDLVHRQLAFISALQREESDPAVLARLCELDRVTSRLRRNAESLLVLTGRRGQRRSAEPVPVDEVLRSVLAEVEDHHRVALRVAGRAQLRGAVVAEVAHMLAELVENALGHSPPDAKVDVVSRVVEGECRVTISDYGVGMTAGELAAANARLRGEQDFLVAPTRCLGHHVVGRLAERLGVRVSLHESPGCGVTALMVLPEELLAERPVELLRR